MSDVDNHDNPTLTMHLQPTVDLHGEQEPAPDPLEPISVRERITLRGLHSSGGIGEVWRAYDEVLGREIALKRLRPDKADSTANRARFYREARLTGQLDHPGIVPVYDYAEQDDGRRCYYTMRFLRGRTLLEVIAEFHEARRAHDLPLMSSGFLELLGHFTSVCNTIAFAHSRGVIHRDLKGDNVIVGDYGEVVVLDWGLAKQLGEGSEAGAGEPSPSAAPTIDVSKTVQGTLLGTPAYMAPEQALGSIDRIDQRTDVYGLAAILYEILTGEPPFREGTLDDIIHAVIHAPPVAPSEKLPGVPPQLEHVCLRGLAKDPEQRVQSAAELAAEVRGWLTALAEQRRTEQERERFFDLSVDLLAIVDRAGKLRSSNAAWNRLLGWPEHVRAELRFIDLIAAEHREQAEAALARIWAGVGGGELEVRVRTASDARRWVHWNLRSIPEEGAIYLVGRDVTARKRSEREVEGLLESAPDASCVIDESGTIVRVNAQLERMFGYPREELLGQPIEILVPTELRERHRGHVARFVAAPQARPMGAALSLQGQRRDGSVFSVEVSLGPVWIDDRLLVACALRDPNARREE
ncbi:MAG TPA: PAS domain S-box protein [Enhygromyxa sp.]|nr:PAS domain S-box protein [Enhygromyxa sp.]